MITQPFTLEDTLAAYKASSDAARDIFNDEKTTEILVALDEELHLNDEDAHVLGREVGYVLIGLTDQNDFTDRLKAAGFAPDTVNAILFEVMKKIFLPLSKALNGQFKKNPAFANAQPEQAEEGSAPAQTPPATPFKQNPVTISVPRYMSAPPPQSPLYVRDENKVPQLDGAVLPTKMTAPRAAVTLGVNDVEPLVTITRTPTPPAQRETPKTPVRETAQPAPPQPVARTPLPTVPTIAPVAELPLGEGDLPVVAPTPAAPVRSLQTPPPAPAASSRPIQVPPAAPQPVVPQSPVRAPVNPPATAAAPNPVPLAATVEKAAPTPPVAPQKSYAADPYREPIDEKDL